MFLDFDGVLHPNFCETADHFLLADALASVLLAASKPPAVVISSSWRFHHAFDDLVSYLPDALGALVIGATPEVEPARHQRYREIQAYMRSVRGPRDWRALDDERIGFPETCPELIFCNGKRGVDRDALALLGRWLAQTA